MDTLFDFLFGIGGGPLLVAFVIFMIPVAVIALFWFIVICIDGIFGTHFIPSQHD